MTIKRALSAAALAAGLGMSVVMLDAWTRQLRSDGTDSAGPYRTRLLARHRVVPKPTVWPGPTAHRWWPDAEPGHRRAGNKPLLRKPPAPKTTAPQTTAPPTMAIGLPRRRRLAAAASARPPTVPSTQTTITAASSKHPTTPSGTTTTASGCDDNLGRPDHHFERTEHHRSRRTVVDVGHARAGDHDRPQRSGHPTATSALHPAGPAGAAQRPSTAARWTRLPASSFLAAAYRRRRRSGVTSTTPAKLPGRRRRTGRGRRRPVDGMVRRLRVGGTAPGRGRRCGMSATRETISASSTTTTSPSYRSSTGCTEVGATGSWASGSPGTSHAPPRSTPGLAEQRLRVRKNPLP